MEAQRRDEDRRSKAHLIDQRCDNNQKKEWLDFLKGKELQICDSP